MIGSSQRRDAYGARKREEQKKAGRKRVKVDQKRGAKESFKKRAASQSHGV